MNLASIEAFYRAVSTVPREKLYHLSISHQYIYGYQRERKTHLYSQNDRQGKNYEIYKAFCILFWPLQIRLVNRNTDENQVKFIFKNSLFLKLIFYQNYAAETYIRKQSQPISQTKTFSLCDRIYLILLLYKIIVYLPDFIRFISSELK